MWNEISDTSGLSRIFKRTVHNAEFKPLPFYKDGTLLKIETRRVDEFFVMNRNGQAVKLTGSSENIREANRIGDLHITDENVTEYLAFFCEHLRDDEGESYRIRTERFPFDHMRAPEFHGYKHGQRLCTAFSFHAGQWCLAMYGVDRAGRVDMLWDVPGDLDIACKP